MKMAFPEVKNDSTYVTIGANPVSQIVQTTKALGDEIIEKLHSAQNKLKNTSSRKCMQKTIDYFEQRPEELKKDIEKIKKQIDEFKRAMK